MRFNTLAVILLFTATVHAAGLPDALSWLKSNQSADGSWGGPYQEALFTPYAMLALFQGEGTSANVSNAAAWLKSDLNDTSSYTWAEADLPGLELLALEQAGNATDLNMSKISDQFHLMLNASVVNGSGGFRGWWTPSGTIEDAVDTAFAARGLVAAGLLNAPNVSAVANYLQSLQNADGSFNFSSQIAQAGFLQGMAPDLPATTAVTLLALKDLGVNAPNPAVQNGLEFLDTQIRAECFSKAANVTSASLASMAFKAFGNDSAAAKAANYLLIVQKPDGGFADSRRSDPLTSNALDAGMAALALQNAAGTDSWRCSDSPPFSSTANVTVNTRAAFWAAGLSANWSVNATVTAPNGTNYTYEMGYDNTTGKFNATFNAADAPGAYAVQVNGSYFHNGFTLDGAFQAQYPTPYILPIAGVTTNNPAFISVGNVSANGTANITVTSPAGLGYPANLSYNSGTGKFEGYFNTTNETGLYSVRATAQQYGTATELSAWFPVAAPTPTPTPSQTPTPTPNPYSSGSSRSGSGSNAPAPTPAPTPTSHPTASTKPNFALTAVTEEGAATATPTATLAPKPTLTPTPASIPAATTSAKRATGLFAGALSWQAGLVVLLAILGILAYSQIQSRMGQIKFS